MQFCRWEKEEKQWEPRGFGRKHEPSSRRVFDSLILKFNESVALLTWVCLYKKYVKCVSALRGIRRKGGINRQQTSILCACCFGRRPVALFYPFELQFVSFRFILTEICDFVCRWTSFMGYMI
uniref:Uncharacterized protein n=1 Tax=Rhizophora mucronata TaxID=61149 RepID=A0A2P2P4M3_RHIMU